MGLPQQSVNGQLSDNALRLVRQEVSLGGTACRIDQLALVGLLTQARGEVARLRSVLAEWEQNQLETTADAYDEGFHDGAEGRDHRNARAVLAEIAGADG